MTVKDRAKMLGELLAFVSGDAESQEQEQEKEQEKVSSEKTGVTKDEISELLKEIQGSQQENESSEGQEKTSEKTQGDDVVDYKGKFEEYQNELVTTKIESGFRAHGVEVPDFNDFREFLDLSKLKDSEGNLSQEEIDKFVGLVVGVATKTPPTAPKKRDITKQGMSRYLKDED